MKPKQNLKIYITGAKGRLGKTVLKLIPNAIPVNLRDSNLDLKQTFKGANAVIHLAGSMKFNDKKELWHANYGLTKRICDSIDPKKTRIIYAGSISVYGKKLAELPANEQTRCRPDSEYAKSKYASEQEVLEGKGNVVLRIGTIYGPGFEDYFKMIEYISKSRMPIIGDGKNHLPFVHVDDVARAIANSVNAKPGVYVVCADPITQIETHEAVCKALRIRMEPKKTSVAIAKALFLLQGMIKKLMNKKQFLTSEHLNILANDRFFNCAKAKKELKFKPRKTPEGIKEMVKEYLHKK
ncbi:MAG: NAD(P)-dependent oxidoreductase [Candidatus Micrarchaeota archaeon]